MKNRLDSIPFPGARHGAPRYHEFLHKLSGTNPGDDTKTLKSLFKSFEKGHAVAGEAISSLGDTLFMGEMLGMFSAMVSCLYLTLDDVPQEMMDELWESFSDTAKEQIAEFEAHQKKGDL